MCFSCNKFFNLQDRKPIALPCTDAICIQCYQLQKEQIQNNKIYCPFDNNHQFEKDQQVQESTFIMRQLQNFDFYNIKCDDHPNENANVYCKDLNKMICGRCLSIDPHSHYITDRTRHFEFQRAFLEDSFQKMIPILKKEVMKIEKLLDNYQQFIQKDRDFTVSQIQEMIKLNMQILQYSDINESLIKKIKDRFEILDFIIPFSLVRQKFLKVWFYIKISTLNLEGWLIQNCSKEQEIYYLKIQVDVIIYHLSFKAYSLKADLCMAIKLEQ
ncbi:tldc domain-containing protein [Stylonychia lemnae]|uniref:Tldc domain-containing protein n=1 Tax=Stylonychia lemnae TaxID=5949 RepID=A0A077ZTE5_STYLE|nr:tldc domain-containing protein [Stylonychia lemnae]|eukprot:CDW73157.1 tldc domain-containing protein [Stylonychia lemnae]